MIISRTIQHHDFSYILMDHLHFWWLLPFKPKNSVSHVLSVNPPKQLWLWYPLPSQTQLEQRGERREKEMKMMTWMGSFNCWIRDWFEVGGSGPWQTWGGDRGRGAHVWAPELGMFEAHWSGFLWKLLSAKQDRGLSGRSSNIKLLQTSSLRWLVDLM